MLNNPTEVILTKGNVRFKPYQYILLNNTVRHDQYYEDIERIKVRFEKSPPNMEQVISTDKKRIESNKFYERKLHHDLTGSRGLNWQCKQELQRLRNDQRDIERDLIRLNHDLTKITNLPLISQSPTHYQNKESSRSQTSRLSSIPEEGLPRLNFEKPKSILGYTSPKNQSPISLNHLPSISKQNKMNSRDDHYRWLGKHSFQQVIAKTSDDRLYLQQHAQIINQQKRLIEQRLKEFLH